MENNRNGRTVVVLGGGGGMGRHAAMATASLAGVGRVLIADREISAARQVASSCGSLAEALELDVTDADALGATLRRADVVLNAVGPYFRFGPPVLRAAIEAGCDYLDLCDDPEPTVAMLEMSAEAERRGVRAVIGMGASPGIVNLLAVVAIRELDEVRRVVTGWNGEGATPVPGSGPAAIEHGIAQATGAISVVSDGRERAGRPLRRVVVEYPGLGRRRARTFGHPEPITLHRTFGLAESVNVTHGRLRFIVPLVTLAWLCDRGLLTTGRAVRMVDLAERRMPSPSLGALASKRRLPPLFALAEGARGGVPAVVGVTPAALPGQNMGAVTGVPLAVAADCLLRGGRMSPGVHPPEAAFDPHEFFDALAPHCPGPASGRSALLVTRSWDPEAPAVYRQGIDPARRRVLADSDRSQVDSARSGMKP